MKRHRREERYGSIYATLMFTTFSVILAWFWSTVKDPEYYSPYMLAFYLILLLGYNWITKMFSRQSIRAEMNLKFGYIATILNIPSLKIKTETNDSVIPYQFQKKDKKYFEKKSIEKVKKRNDIIIGLTYLVLFIVCFGSVMVFGQLSLVETYPKWLQMLFISIAYIITLLSFVSAFLLNRFFLKRLKPSTLVIDFKNQE